MLKIPVLYKLCCVLLLLHLLIVVDKTKLPRKKPLKRGTRITTQGKEVMNYCHVIDNLSIKNNAQNALSFAFHNFRIYGKIGFVTFGFSMNLINTSFVNSNVTYWSLRAHFGIQFCRPMGRYSLLNEKAQKLPIYDHENTNIQKYNQLKKKGIGGWGYWTGG